MDIISPIEEVIVEMCIGPGHAIRWTGHVGADVEQLLRTYGIRVYGRRVNTKVKPWEYRCKVTKAQRRWAEYVMMKSGYNITSPVLKVYPPGPIKSNWGVDTKPIGLSGMIVRRWLPKGIPKIGETKQGRGIAREFRNLFR